ncbi:MAG: S8 family serine peptidase [Verrucomicrobia subdivision 3 bacterium]|nr:S8 family serine peptidase [Limisphaerales bacterium]
MKRFIPVFAVLLVGCHTPDPANVSAYAKYISHAAPGKEGNLPFTALIPKKATGAAQFLKEHPQYDGRGVVVAIFDTGVDPGAPGLQTTPDGRPKIVDVIDGSGSGDVRTTTVRELKNGKLTGLTGRTLTLPKAWKSRDKTYRVGMVEAWRIFPRDLVSRLKTKRREAWDIQQRKRTEGIERTIANWDKANPKPTQEQMLQRDDLNARLVQLKSLQAKYRDPGPIYDCLVFHDGKQWNASVDTDEDGDFSNEKQMTNFRVNRDYGTFGGEAQMNFATNIYRDGDLLSIVVDCGAHGTHVAGIVAAHFPKQPELNGLAPGAQIVSVKIGDTRLGSSSTATGQMRGIISVLQNKCDLINMSYGGPSSRPNVGRIYTEYANIVNRHGVIFCASAGNNGPALSTVGSPGGTTSALLGIGASVTPQMMLDQYGMRATRKDMQYTWSSRGPALDGDLGVDLTAPGGAIAPVPNWLLRRNTQMNGTSMSSPNACGNIALLLSALKSEKANCTPHRVRRALENTAKPIGGLSPHEQGRGMIQIHKAYDWLKNNPAVTDSDFKFDVSIRSRGNARGIYLREPFEVKRVHSVSVTLKPVFHRDTKPTEKINFEKRLLLHCEADWVEHASQILLANDSERITVEVDPTGLAPGVHYTEVVGTDADAPQGGALVRVPVTVIIPEQVEGAKWKATLTFKGGDTTRRFLAVPTGATWADLHVRTIRAGTDQRITMHAVQLLPGLSFRAGEAERYITLREGAERVESFAVTGGRTLELCLAQYWSSLGEAEAEFTLQFHGLVPASEVVSMDGNDLTDSVVVTAPLRDERVSPSGSFKTWRRSVRPTNAVIRPLDPVRDRLDDEEQIHEMMITYNFDQANPARVTPVLTVDYNDGSDYFFESGVWQLFDAQKRRLGSGSHNDPVSLAKGKHVLRYHVRHPDKKLLERFQHSLLMLDQPASRAVSLAFHEHAEGAIRGTARFAARTLRRGDSIRLHFAIPKHAQLSSGVKPGDILRGEIQYGGNTDGLNGVGQKPGGFPVQYIVPAARNSFPSTQPKVVPAKKPEPKKLTDEEKLAEKNLELALAKLKPLDPVKDADAILKATDAVLKLLDLDGLQQYLGTPADETAADKDALKKKWDAHKAALITALRAQARVRLAQAKADKKTIAAFEAAWKKLIRWSPATDAANAELLLESELLHERLGNAVKILAAKISKSPESRAHYEKRAELLGKIGWTEWQAHEKKSLLVRFPSEYPPF